MTEYDVNYETDLRRKYLSPRAREKFDRWLNEVRAEAWDEAETAIHEWYKTYQETLYTAPENPYRTNEKQCRL